jgi:hypothetical protein
LLEGCVAQVYLAQIYLRQPRVSGYGRMTASWRRSRPLASRRGLDQ